MLAVGGRKGYGQEEQHTLKGEPLSLLTTDHPGTFRPSHARFTQPAVSIAPLTVAPGLSLPIRLHIPQKGVSPGVVGILHGTWQKSTWYSQHDQKVSVNISEG